MPEHSQSRDVVESMLRLHTKSKASCACAALYYPYPAQHGRVRVEVSSGKTTLAAEVQCHLVYPLGSRASYTTKTKHVTATSES